MKKKLSGYSLTALTLAMCTQRMSIAVGNIFYGLAIVLFLVDVIERRRRGETFHLAPHVKHYFWAYAFFALTLLPSALLSPDVSFSFGKYLNSIVGRIVVLPMLLFLDVDEKAIKKALLCFIAFIAFDGLCTFGERLITGADRAHGLGDGWLRHASIVATVFPASIILWLQKAEKISHRNGLLVAAVLIVLRRHWQRHKKLLGGHFRICDCCDRREFAGTKFRDYRGPFGIKLLFCRDCRKSRPFPTVFFYFECNDRSVQWRPNRSMEESGCHDSG